MIRRTAMVVGTLIATLCTDGWLHAQRPGPSPTASAFVLERGRAGQFEVGMTADEVYRLLSREQVRLVALFPEGHFQPELQLQLPGFGDGPALTAPIREWPCGSFALWGLSVHDPRFRTSDGLGVGSTLGDLKVRFPAARVTNVGADGGPVVVMEQRGLTFRMEVSQSFPDSTRVSGVWVIPQPVEVRDRRCPQRVF